MAAAGTASAKITVDGTPLKQQISTSLVHLRVSLTSGAASHAAMRYDDVADAGAAFKVGSEVKIEVTDAGGKTDTVFTGDVLGLGVEVVPGRTQLIVEAFDASYKLGTETNLTSHLTTSVGDIVKKIAGDAGLSPKVTGPIDKVKPDHLQALGTPHRFLDYVADTFGYEWFVDGKDLTVRPREASGAPLELSATADLRYFTARASAVDVIKEAEARSWNVDSKKAETSIVKLDGKTAKIDVPAAEKARKGAASKPVNLGPTNANFGAETKDVAQGVVNRHDASILSGRGEVDANPKLKPGGRVKIADVAPDWNGTYYLTEVEHVLGRDQPFISRFEVGALAPTTAVDLLGTTPVGAGQRMASGLAVGIVTSLADPEGLNRVKVKLPALSDKNDSGWCRVVTPGAGKDRGMALMPELEDEVLVGFEHGDLQQPYVLGGLWNGQDKPPADAKITADADVPSRSIVSRLGHKFVMADGTSPDKQGLLLELADSKGFIDINGEKFDIIAKEKQPILIETGKASIKIEDNGDITLKGNNITLDASGKIVLKAGSDVEIKAGANLKATGGAKVDVKASAPLTLESSAITNVKGAMVKIN